MTASRAEILGRVRAALADVGAEGAESPGPAPAYRVESGLARAELAGRFAERVAEYRAGVRRDSADRGAASVAEALAAHGASRVAVAPGYPDAWRPDGFELIEDSPALAATDLDGVDGALTGCALAIADTGTIVLDAGPGQGRRALTLVPDLHVCVVEATQIVGSVPEAIRALEPDAAAAIRPLTLISGPSATSDIELSRVEGVHGPRRLEVVILA